MIVFGQIIRVSGQSMVPKQTDEAQTADHQQTGRGRRRQRLAEFGHDNRQTRQVVRWWWRQTDGRQEELSELRLATRNNDGTRDPEQQRCRK